MRAARIVVHPEDALLDVPRAIRVEGFPPASTVTIEATTMRAGQAWRSRAAFLADAAGGIDLAASAPLPGGSYAGIAPMGLVWSQEPDDPARRLLFDPDVAAPLITGLVASGGGAVAQAAFTQRVLAAGVMRREVREEGLVGTLFLPAGAGPHPALMLLNGSDGGVNEPRAALYAAHGYATLALGYFGMPGLSPYISNTPLEYFAAGLAWLRRAVRPARDFVALQGESRGGELVLLLGATFPEAVSAVLAFVPGAVVHSGQNAADPKVGRNGPTWLLGGRPLPHLWDGNRTATWAPFDEGPEPHRHELALLTALDDASAVARARIPVERIRGPVFLTSGTDDGSWPSSRYARMVRDALAARGHGHEVQWCDYQGAGHSMRTPYVPATGIVHTHPVSGRVTTGGGTPAANAHAGDDAWRAALGFLARAVAAHARSPVPGHLPGAAPG